MKLYDTHFHLDLQKNVKAAIEEINTNKRRNKKNMKTHT